MTALERYVRLESGGVWRADANAQRRDVNVSFGDATLVISDAAGRPLSHWSLPAITRQNPGRRPAVYAPDVEADEVLEIAEETMIEAIEEVRKAIRKTEPKPGKLRHWLTAGVIVLSLLLAVFWLPGALMRQALAVVPASKRAEIGAAIFHAMQDRTGSLCASAQARDVTKRLAERLFGANTMAQVVIVPELARGVVSLPGDLIVLDARILRATDEPTVAAGYVLAGFTEAQANDPLAVLLQDAGLRGTLGLLTTGDVTPDMIATYAAKTVVAAWEDVPAADLQPVFDAAQVPLGPYAAVVGLEYTGDTANAGAHPLILDDTAWVSLQNICLD